MSFDKFKTFLASLAETANKADPSGELSKIVGKLASLDAPGTAGTTVSEEPSRLIL